MPTEKRPPARIIKRGGVKHICKVPSHKYGGMVKCEFLLEADLCSLANINPRVKYLCPQPFTVCYFHPQKKNHYSPDLFMKDDKRGANDETRRSKGMKGRNRMADKE